MSDSSRQGRPVDLKAFNYFSDSRNISVTKSLLTAAWFGILVIASPAAAAGDQPKGPPAAITPDGGRYWGSLVDGVRQGDGYVEWSNGSSYSGGFVDGLFSGKGRFVCPNGDVVEGEFFQGLPSGTVVLTTSAGVVYKGQMRGAVFEGRGRLQDNDGVYEGEFQKGLYHGQGHLVSKNLEYTGEFREGQFWGKGEHRHKNGRTYKGEFVRGEFEGKGRFTIPDGRTYEGDFVDGKFQGQGVITYPGGARQEGQFRDWRLDGPGKYTDPEGNVFEGEFKAGELVGATKFRNSDGDLYVGELKNWLPHGKGELRLANGDVYQGGFRYGQYEGEGTLTYAKAQSDGRTQDKGVWEYGTLKAKNEERRRRTEANVERALYSQVEQLNRAVRELKPRSSRAMDMYLLAVAGDGTQEVFRREVEFVRAQFEEKFGTQGHAITLINSRNTVGSNPLATVTSIREAVSAIAARMDKELDILFLYLTSHGSKEGTISLEMDGMRFADLSATELAAVLKESGIRWKVVVVSACYAGSFMEPLKDAGTLMIAAARADRRSFGCADESDFTYFGRAFFKESVPATDSFEGAFAKSALLIKEWEDRDNAARTAASVKDKDEDKDEEEPKAERHSLPQMEAPEAIRQHLKLWRAQFSKKAAKGSAP